MATGNPVLAHAVQVLQGLPNQIDQTRQGLANVNLGPFGIDVSCTTGFLGIYTHHYTITVDFGPAYRPALQNILNWAAAQSGEFAPLYQQLSGWFGGPLQAISNVMGELQALSQTLVGAPPPDVPPLRRQLSDLIPQVIDLLNQSSQQLNGIDQGLGNFLQQLGSYNQQLSNIRAQLDQNMQKVEEEASDTITGWVCGSGDGFDQVNTWKAAFQASLGMMAATLGTAANYTDQANAGLAQIIGLVTNSLSQFQPVVAQLEQASDADLSRYVEALHLDAACGLWSSLAAYASGDAVSI